MAMKGLMSSNLDDGIKYRYVIIYSLVENPLYVVYNMVRTFSSRLENVLKLINSFKS